MRKYDAIMKFHDTDFDCEAEFKSEDCKNSPFTKEFESHLDEFEEKCGEISSITIIFKKEPKKKDKRQPELEFV